MKMRTNIKYLVKKYRAEISTWREVGPRFAGWEAIKREISSREGLSADEQPTGEGFRRAWLRLQGIQRLQPFETVQTNTPTKAALEPSGKSLPMLQTFATVQTNRLVGAADAGFHQSQPPLADKDVFSSDHKRQMQAALERGNSDDL